MKINTIVIKNFKGFENETVHLNPHFTVFIGKNASGKTTVLDALAVAAGGFLRGIDVAKHEARSVRRDEIRIVSDDRCNPSPQLPLTIQASGTIGTTRIQECWGLTVEAIAQKTTTTYKQAKNVQQEAQKMLKDRRNQQQVTFPVIAYHGTGRLWAHHEEKKTPYQKRAETVEQGYANCLSAKSSSKEFVSWYKTTKDELLKFHQEHDSLFFDLFNRTIESIIPGKMWQNIDYSQRDDDMIGTFKGAKKLTFKQLSDGYRNIIALVADIAYRCIRLNPHLGENAVRDTPGMVLIDEIEMHLHPNWQRTVVADLKRVFPNIQFVATTHSPFIVQSLQGNELWNLEQPMDVPQHELKIDTGATQTSYENKFKLKDANSKTCFIVGVFS